MAVLVISFVLVLFLGGCIASYDYNVKGEWNYELFASDGHAYDKGTVTFTGNPMAGYYDMLNYDNQDFSGAFTVKGEEIRLTGSVNWKGTLSDENTMSGDWWDNIGTEGTFTAARQE